MTRMTLAVASILFSMPIAAATDALTFTIRSGSQSTASGAGSSLRWITPTDVANVVPGSGPPTSAEPFGVHLNLATMAGDGDGDGFHPEFPVAPKLDALHIKIHGETTATLRDVFFSTDIDFPCAGSGVIEPGDISAIALDANTDGMIDDVLIRTALGIPPSALLDVDAFTKSALSVYLSFEQDMFILGGTVWLEDGGVVVIPASAITWSGYQAVAVSPSSAVVAFHEAGADAICANAVAGNHLGSPVTAIGDLDGLEVDPAGGSFLSDDGSLVLPNLIFCGEQLTGGGIVSTVGGGSIAVLNGIPMGTVWEYGPTTGSQIGMKPDMKTSLNGLALSGPTHRFVLDTKTPYLPAPDTVHFAAGGATPGLYVTWLMRIYGDNTPGGYQPSLDAWNPCFPDWFMSNASLAGIVADANGVAEGYVPYSGGVPAGMTLVLQGITLVDDAYVGLSAPITMQF